MESKKVEFKIFIWAIGVIIVIFGWVFSAYASINNKVDTFNSDIIKIQVQLSQIQTDIAWIKNNLK